jgi:putative transposase
LEAIWSIIEVEAQRILRIQCASEHRIKKWLIAMSDKIVKAFKFHFKPSKTQSQKLNDILRLCADLYNAALSERREAYKLNRISINYQAQQNQLPEIKETNPEYKNIHSQVLQNVLKRVELAFQGFFSRVKKGVKAGFPRFRSLNRYDSFTFPQSGFSLIGNKLTLSKIGTVKLKLSRQVVGKIKTLTIKNECGKWFAIFTVETSAQPLPKTGEEIGLDAGIACFLKLSDGSDVDNPRFGEKLQKSLRVAQRSVSRKKKGGQNRKKSVLKLRKIHQRIKNCRTDFQHKAAYWLVNSYDLICIEKLKVSNMLRNHHLARVISDVSWSSFYQILKCKAENAGKTVVEVPPHHTSQTCSRCGHCEKANRKTQADFVCLKCHFSINADHNAAINILRLGKSELAKTKAVGLRVAKESLTITVSV